MTFVNCLFELFRRMRIWRGSIAIGRQFWFTWFQWWRFNWRHTFFAHIERYFNDLSVFHGIANRCLWKLEVSFDLIYFCYFFKVSYFGQPISISPDLVIEFIIKYTHVLFYDEGMYIGTTEMTLSWLNLRMSVSFFCCFLKHTLAKPKKNGIQKNEHFPASIKTRSKIYQYTLRKKNNIFEKSPLPAILCDFTLLTIIEHAFTKKSLMKLPFFIAISCVFQSFSESPYVSRIWFAKNVLKVIWNTLAK